MSRESYLVKTTLILGFGTICSQFMGFFLLPLYTRYLSPSEYGFADVAIVFLTLLIPAITLETKMAVFRFLVESRGNRPTQEKVISNNFFIVTILFLPWVAIITLAGQFIAIPHLFPIMGTGIMMLFSQQFLQIARGLGNNIQFALASIIIGVVTLLGALLFIVEMRLGIDGMLFSIASAHLMASFYLFFKLRIFSYISFRHWDWEQCREMLGYSTPLIPNGLAWWMNNAANRVIITIFIGTAANGIFAVATKFSSILSGLFSVFTMSWTESATLHIDAPDRDAFFSKVTNVAVRIFGASALIIISVVPFILPLMVTDEFSSAYQLIPIMILGVFFNVLVGIYSAIYIAKRLSVKVMQTTLLGAVLNIILTFVLLPLFGLHGAASAATFTFLILAIIRHYDVKKFIRIKYETRTLAFLAITFVMVVALYYSGNIWAQLFNIAFTTVVALVLNRSQITFLIGVLRRRLTR